LLTPSGVERINVETAQDMADAVRQNASDIFISAAAVADYRVQNIAAQKIKKNSDALTLALTRNPDILSEAAISGKFSFVVGFAAETENLASNAKEKLQRKQLDMIIANDVSQSDRGFDVDTNQVSVIWSSGQMEIPLMPKSALARKLIEIIAERYHAKSTG
jgi:phosphopantothenoylcysteine decarboxylase/phosphopantothenate--cysteine ligase